MTNKEIAKTFQLLGDIMELHGENSFKIRSYQNAYIALRKLETPLSEMPREEIDAIKGVGKAIGDKIQELLASGQMATLEKYRAMTPPGVQEILAIPGIGPKKTLTIWKDLGAESVGELLYAVNENRLIELKGFGAKTQEDIRQKLEYYQRSLGHYRYAALEAEAQSLLAALQTALPDGKIALAGDIARRCNTLETIDFVATEHSDWPAVLQQAGLTVASPDASPIQARTASEVPVRIFLCSPEEFGSKQFRYTSGQTFMEAFVAAFPGVDFRGLPSEEAVFQKVALPFIAPELRDWPASIELAQQHALPELLSEKDIRGVIHAHSTYSDGLHTLSDMAEYARTQGYEYLGITDHSKSAFYAQGLEPERVLMQWREVDALNAGYAAAGHKFRIFKGIESDILNDGSLDYDAELLAGFDFIIASVHSNLRMDETKATRRLLTAIENPHTTILGHPTGRLLLSRAGYPIDHRLLIDACAANGVAIELNANPYRLDLDWTWIPYAMEKGVLIAVNPDAHSREGIHDIHFGVCSARKGGLTAAACLNVLDAEGFEEWAGRKG